MKKTVLAVLAALLAINPAEAWPGNTEKIDSLFPVRGFCIGAPRPDGLNDFIKFIDEELAPRKVNTLILRVDFNFQYESHPELRDSGAFRSRM